MRIKKLKAQKNKKKIKKNKIKNKKTKKEKENKTNKQKKKQMKRSNLGETVVRVSKVHQKINPSGFCIDWRETCYPRFMLC